MSNRNKVKVSNMFSFDGIQDPQEHIELQRTRWSLHLRFFFINSFQTP